ncbi:SRPBCC family protein [Dactylosporangium salmoneum]|uniref:Polyketide cyclase / dehydrase and lipid transport n=1 Tax=Dactylosporangium salmoneum TaxID=53361 RepID=A0ABN3FMM4_9ACTN
MRRVEVHGGGRFTTVRRVAGVDQGMLQEVTEDSPPHRWAARAVAGAVRPAATVTVEPLDGGARSRVTFRLDFEGRGAGDLLVPLVRRMAARAAPRSYARLKALLEAGPNQDASASRNPSPPDQAT